MNREAGNTQTRRSRFTALSAAAALFAGTVTSLAAVLSRNKGKRPA